MTDAEQDAIIDSLPDEMTGAEVEELLIRIAFTYAGGEHLKLIRFLSSATETAIEVACADAYPEEQRMALQ